MTSFIYEDHNYHPCFMQGHFYEDYDYPLVFPLPCKLKSLNQKLIKHERYVLSMWRVVLHLDAFFACAAHHEPYPFTKKLFRDLLALWHLWSWHHRNCFMILRSSWLLIHIQGTFDSYIWTHCFHARDIAIPQVNFFMLSIPRSVLTDFYIEHHLNDDVDRLMFWFELVIEIVFIGKIRNCKKYVVFTLYLQHCTCKVCREALWCEPELATE